MDTQKLFYKESLEYFLTCLEEGKSAAKWSDLPADIPDNTDSKDFVNTRNLLRDRLDKHIRKMEDCGLVLKRIWSIRKKLKGKTKNTSIKLSTEEDNSQFKDHLKALVVMETTIASIGQKDDKPDTSPGDTTSQALPEERKETEKNQQSADLHKEDSVDEDNKDVVIGDNSNTKLPKIPESELNINIRNLTDEKIKISKEKESLSKKLEKLRSECDRLEAEVKNLEEMNTDLKDENERLEKLRSECERLEAEVKNLEGMNTDLKDENERLEKLRSECERLEAEVKNLEGMNTDLKDENERLPKIESELNDNIRNLTDEKIKISQEKESLSKKLEKLRSECDRLEAEVKNLEEMNTDLKDENERYMYEKKYNKVTEKNTVNEQRCETCVNHWSKLEDDNKELKERCEELKKNTKTLEDKNSKLQQRLDRLHSPISVQVKDLQKRIDIKTAENESLIKRLKSQGKGTKETERSEQRPQRPQTAPHSSARQYKELQNQIATLTAEKESLMQRLPRPQTAPHAGGRQCKELQNQIATLTAEKESLMQRLSMVAGMKMRDNNPGIADLSDPNRPEKLAEQFREIYDNAWTNLLDYITDSTDTTDDIAVQEIVAVTQKIFEQCQTEVGEVKHRLLRIIGYPEDTFEKQYTGGKAGHDPIVKMVKDLVQISAERTYERVLQKIKEIREIKAILQIGGESADVFLTKCSKLCLFMCVKDPPVVLDFNFKRGDMFDKDRLSAFTTSGNSVDYLVWPVMYLHENGPVMSKGVAQGRKK